MAPKRMTANPIKPARYRPGKAVAEVSSSEEDSESEQPKEEAQKPSKRPPPSASSFPKSATQISTNLKNVDLNAQQRAQAARKPVINEDDFETEEESSAEGAEGSESGSEEEEESSEEEDEESSEDDAATRRKMLRPVFVKKDARKANIGPDWDKTEDERWKEEERRKKERADAIIQEELEKQAAAKAAGKKYWDDEDNIVDEVDDTDDLDPEAERAAWKLREFTRVKRDRDALIAAEKEHEEVERRRNLSKEERDAEDKIHLDKQKAEKDGKGQMGFMQKYYHKGAFFTEDLEKGGLANRDIMGGRYEDDVSMRDALPAYMQIRDMTKLGKKGHTKYKDMKSEDTGRWGDFLDNRKPRADDGDWSRDERFRRDYDGGDRTGPSGANASSLGERKRPPPGDDRRDDKRARVD
jgi:microfibrillar-associated protein 1